MTFVYDGLNRLRDISYLSSPMDNVHITYYRNGSKKSVSTPDTLASYLYDANNRLNWEYLVVDGISYGTSYDYDDLGNLRFLTYPSGRTVEYERYPASSRIKKLVGYVDNVIYHPSGAMKSLEYHNLVRTDFTYNNRYWIDSLQTKTAGAPSADILSYDYASYDPVGNVGSILDLLDPARNRSMTYDDLDRLSVASGVWGSTSFVYDVLGNRIGKTTNNQTATYHYTSAAYSEKNLLTSVTGVEIDTFDYDTMGNMVKIRGLNLNYDFANRLVYVDDPATGNATTYLYDGEGRRVKKISNTVAGTQESVIYHYDLSGNVLAEDITNGFGAFSRKEYFYVNGQHVARVDSDTGSPACTFCLNASGVFQGGIFQGQVSLSWPNLSGSGAASYEVWRLGPGGIYSATLGGSQFAYTDAVPADYAYIYRIVARDAAGNVIFISQPNLVTTVTFLDDPLNPPNQRTVIKAQHISDLRTAVNAVRTTAGLIGIGWTDSVLISPQERKSMRTVHVQELRTYLGEALSALGLITPVWTDADLGDLQIRIKAVHLEQIRETVK